MADREITRLVRLSPEDNVAVAVSAIQAGETVMLEGRPVTAVEPIPAGHKIALTAIQARQKVLKYGLPIGSATCDIAAGRHVHTHNLVSDYLPE
jgi:altronate dehydratase